MKRTPNHSSVSWQEDIPSFLATLSQRQEGVEHLWRYYRPRLLGLARTKINDRLRRVFDEEDLASAAFQGFLSSCAQGHCDNLSSEEDIWRMLSSILSHKVTDQRLRNDCQKRGGGNIRGESVFVSHDSVEDQWGESPSLSPDLFHELRECAEEYLASLDDELLHEIAVQRMRGNTNDQIAISLSMSPRTVRRKAKLIGKLWKQMLELQAGAR